MPERWKQVAQAVGGTLLAVALVALVAWFGTGPEVGGDGEEDPASGPATTSLSPSAVVPSAPPGASTPAAPVPTPEPGPTGRPTPTPTATPTDPLCTPVMGQQELVVVSFNIKSGRWGGSFRLAAIAAALRGWGADIVLLQEVDKGRPTTGRVDMAAWLGTELGMYSIFGSNVRYGPGAEYGTAVLSRFPILEGSGNTPLPNRPGMQQRGLLRAVVSVRGQQISVYNTHLQHTSASMRLDQARAIAPVLAADPLPKIVGGDFNAGPDTPVMATVRRVVEDTWSAVGSGSGRTAPSGSPRARIDYLLHQGLTPLRAEVMPALLSDHRALRATYGISVLAGLDCPSPAG